MSSQRDKQKETELERILKAAYTPEEEQKKAGWWQRFAPGDDSPEASLTEGFSPEVKAFILKWAWIVSLIMLALGYILIFFILFPEKRPF